MSSRSFFFVFHFSFFFLFFSSSFHSLKQHLEKVRVDILKQLGDLQGAPSVQMQEVPPEFVIARGTKGNNDGGGADDVRNMEEDDGGTKPQHESELYDGEMDQDN